MSRNVIEIDREIWIVTDRYFHRSNALSFLFTSPALTHCGYNPLGQPIDNFVRSGAPAHNGDRIEKTATLV